MAVIAPQYYRLINLGMLPRSILVCQGIDISDLPEFAKKFGIIRQEDSALTTGKGFTVFCENGNSIIWLKDKPVTPLAISVLAHEALHAIGYVVDHAGIPYEFKNDEVLTYGMDFIVQAVMEDFKGQKIKESRVE